MARGVHALTLLLVGVLLACTAATTLASEEKIVGPGFMVEETESDSEIPDLEELDEEDSDGLYEDEDENERDDDDSILGQSDEEALEEAARVDAYSNAQDQCDAKTECLNRHREHVRRLTEAHERSVKACEAKRAEKQKSWTKFMEHCQKQAKEHCAAQEKKCIEERKVSKHVNFTLSSCQVCKASTKCVMTMKLPTCSTVFSIPKPNCNDMCETLCPAQTACEKANVKAEKEYHTALQAAQKAERACEQRNENAAQQAVRFVAECEARNKKLMEHCDANQERMQDLQVEKGALPAEDHHDLHHGPAEDDDKLGDLPALKCPVLKCEAPKTKPLMCHQTLPKPPRRRHCAQTCTTKDCPSRAKCERSNNSLLRHIAREEHKFQMCSITNMRRRISIKHLEDSCVRERVVHIAKCQIAHSEAVLAHHEKIMDCARMNEVGDWHHCGALKFKAPVCRVFVCKQASSIHHAAHREHRCTFRRVQNLKRRHFSRRTLRPCKKLCSHAFYSKWRGLAVVKHRISKWHHSKAFRALSTYKKHRFLCKRQACAKNAFRTFRRVLVPCPLGPRGNFCRKMRHYLAVRTVKKGYVVKRTERKLSKCKPGVEGRACRRVVGRWMRVQLRKCPAGKFQVRCLRVQRSRERRKLRACAKASDTVKYGWQCRRLRSRCIKMFTDARWCKKSRSKKACMDRAYANVRGKCYV